MCVCSGGLAGVPACADRQRGTCCPESWEAVDGLVTEARRRARGLETAKPWFPISPGGVVPFSVEACPLRSRAVSALQSETAGRPAAEVPVLPVEDALVSLQLVSTLPPRALLWGGRSSSPPRALITPAGGLPWEASWVSCSATPPRTASPSSRSPWGPSPAQMFPLSHLSSDLSRLSLLP